MLRFPGVGGVVPQEGPAVPRRTGWTDVRYDLGCRRESAPEARERSEGLATPALNRLTNQEGAVA